jgi:hypothetical protein
MTAPTMTGPSLFIEMVLRLQHYSDAAVLWIFLKEKADEREYTTTAVKMALDQLTGTVNRRSVQRSIERLQELGFIQVRIHANTGTKVTVDRAAVLRLLRDPLPERLPGLSRKVFPFLDAWVADAAATHPAGEGAPPAASVAAHPNLSQVDQRAVAQDQSA